ncbi:MAG: hypothetical protein JW395_3441 [Nitrospira sp.]|nr:hypothetical protein [Nitrospira sp.]
MAESLSIFVGSTFADLEAHRDAVLYALQRLEAVARGMEHFGSLPGRPKDECLRKVRTCRAYIGILAMRYGSIDQETGMSITELEYEEAQRFHLRPLIYLIDEDRQPVLPRHVDFGEPAEKLKALKSRLKEGHVVNFFTTPDDLAMRVTQDVARLMKEGCVPVQESALAQIVNNLPRADWPDDDEFAYLKKEIGSLADPIGSDIVLREALQFIFCGDNLSAAFLVTRSTPLSIRQATDLLVKITGVVGSVALKGYKVMEKEGCVSPEFVKAFEQHLFEKHRLPLFVRQDPKGEAGNPVQAPDAPPSESKP